MEKKYEYDLDGKPIYVTAGKVAEQAGGSCLIQYGDTVVLVTATASKEPREGIDFFPLSVDFEERLYSVGKIPGGFIKREGRPSEKAILTARLIDRPIRPLFPDGYRNDVQIIATVLSVDQNYTPDIVAMIGSSISLSISDIPFQGPTAAVLVGLVDGDFVINPDCEQREKSDLHLVVAGTEDAITMVEAEANEVGEDKVLEGILFAHDYIKGLCSFINNISKDIGKPKQEYMVFKPDTELEGAVREFATEGLVTAIQTIDKQEREENIQSIKEETLENFAEEYPEQQGDIEEVVDAIIKEEVRELILKKGIRPDNRKMDEIRPISCDIALLPRAHGSALFTRGQTQVLTVATLGASSDVQIIDGITEDEFKRYMHHYNFPPYSVGDTRFMRGPGRREIGHGALAERALEPVLPSEEEFPYTIRLVSEVLSSNGSSSQASVCGSTLALLDAGVPIKSPVAGIAMGLIKSGDKTVILTDILGMEDHLGDMDLKVAGTRKGITAIQMDIKISGIDRPILKEALSRAREDRLAILDKMNEAISSPRKELSPYAPRIFTMQVETDKIRDIIGPGGKMINKIIDETGVKIDIDDDGKVSIAAESSESGQKAMELIEQITKDVEIGDIYMGRVVRVVNFGAFVEIINGKEGLVHISNIAHERIGKVGDVLSVGDEVMVKVIDIDDQDRINLSRKAVLPKKEKSNNKNSRREDR
ncbi:MAG: polyribonucleotide nucleotidyltransferase [Tissierellia bacterium]|nr:polyribonucleotide nucleotidyltransferase [Tissierellia bacterium]